MTTRSATSPPICRLCGQAHWIRDGHRLTFEQVAEVLSPPPGLVSVEVYRPPSQEQLAAAFDAPKPVTKPTRKEYLKLKARDRRKRERAAREKG